MLQLQQVINNMKYGTTILLIISYIIICFDAQNIYKLRDVAALEIKPQRKYFSITCTHCFRKSECHVYQN